MTQILLAVGTFAMGVQLMFRLPLRKFGAGKHLYAPDVNEDEEHEEADAVVIGAGVVGTALATALAKQGRKVIVIERSLAEPNRIVGELLQPGGVEKLHMLGLSECLEGIEASHTSGYVVLKNGKPVSLDYPLAEKDGAVKKGERVEGVSFHHGRFIQRLRQAAEATEGVTLQEGTVTQLLKKENDAGETCVVGVECKSRAGVRSVYAPLVISCDGHYSKFRKELVKTAPLATSSFAGIILDDVRLEQHDRGHVIIGSKTPILAYPISHNQVRVLVDIQHPMPSDTKQFMLDTVAPHLPESIRARFVETLEVKQVRSMPCSRLHPECGQMPGLLLIGDSLNMRHPLTGGGMTVGLSDAVLARDVLAKLPSFRDQGMVQDALHEFLKARISHACCINVLAQALYRVFSEYDVDSPHYLPMMGAMRDACFSYFEAGDVFVAGPIGMLSGLITNPWTLILHFCLVAVFAFWQTLTPFPTPARLSKCFQIFASAARLITPLMFHEHVMSYMTVQW